MARMSHTTYIFADIVMTSLQRNDPRYEINKYRSIDDSAPSDR